ncbi:hypothetical protein pipiens_012119 [Culex pipiens pipiens]|uniref:Uncharacterized protein n=1 Tax=Culex pipiens pipiens TaxID=38569 RepID=A0ABD1D3M0_CULPP
MKSLLPSILALTTLAGVVTCGPIAISDNNIGDIITVGMNIDANVQSEVHTNIANIIAAILIKMGDQQQRPPMPPPGPPGPPGPPPTTPAPPILPPIYPPQPAMGVDDLVSAIQEIRQKSANLSKEQKEQLWRDHSEEFVKQLMASSCWKTTLSTSKSDVIFDVVGIAQNIYISAPNPPSDYRSEKAHFSPAEYGPPRVADDDEAVIRVWTWPRSKDICRRPFSGGPDETTLDLEKR